MAKSTQPPKSPSTAPRLQLTGEEGDALRTYVARRVPELARDAPDLEGSMARARRAKGEWLLDLYSREGNRVGAALLCELIADSYGVPR